MQPGSVVNSSTLEIGDLKKWLLARSSVSTLYTIIWSKGDVQVLSKLDHVQADIMVAISFQSEYSSEPIALEYAVQNKAWTYKSTCLGVPIYMHAPRNSDRDSGFYGATMRGPAAVCSSNCARRWRRDDWLTQGLMIFYRACSLVWWHGSIMELTHVLGHACFVNALLALVMAPNTSITNGRTGSAGTVGTCASEKWSW
jgi:hypothetical protein